MNQGGWNLYTIDLADYIDVEPGILYKVELGMRRSYSLYTCSNQGGTSKYEESLQEAEEQSRAFWDDPENFMEITRRKYITTRGSTGRSEIIPAMMLISAPIKRFREIFCHQTWD